MTRACERPWIKVPGLGHWTRLAARPEGPSYRTVIPRPTTTSGQVGILGAHNGERPTRHDANHVGRYRHGTGPSLHRPPHNQGSRSGRPVTGTHQSDNPAAAIDQRVWSQEPTTLTHSGQQSPTSDVSQPQSSTWSLHHTEWRYKIWQVETRHQAILDPQDRRPAEPTWMESSSAQECQWYAKCQGR